MCGMCVAIRAMEYDCAIRLYSVPSVMEMTNLIDAQPAVYTFIQMQPNARFISIYSTVLGTWICVYRCCAMCVCDT